MGHAIGDVHEKNDPRYCRIMDCFRAPDAAYFGYCSAQHYELNERLDRLMHRETIPKPADAKLYRLCLYVEVDMEGMSPSDALHRIEQATDLDNVALPKAIATIGGGWRSRGNIRRVQTLTAYEVPQ